MQLVLPQPYHVDSLLDFLRVRAVDGLEWFHGREYARIVNLPAGPGVVYLQVGDGHVDIEFEVAYPDDLGSAVTAVRRVLDLDRPAEAIDRHLARDPLLAPLVEREPGIRLPGTFEPFEAAVRAIVGQQISVVGARTVLARIVAKFGEPLATVMASEFGLTHAFPSPRALAAADEQDFSMPRSRARSIIALARAVDSGELSLTNRADAHDIRADLLAIGGIGPWTADYIRMRALGDPDVLLSTDLVLARVLQREEVSEEQAADWAPWRSYATLRLWRTA